MPRGKGSPVYTALIAAFERGDQVLVEPMDYIILDNLPPEGTMFAGAYPDGPTTPDLAKRLFEGKIPITQFVGRMRILRVLGLAVSRPRRGLSDLVWQVTPKGREVVEKWKGGE